MVLGMKPNLQDLQVPQLFLNQVMKIVCAVWCGVEKREYMKEEMRACMRLSLERNINPLRVFP